MKTKRANPPREGQRDLRQADTSQLEKEIDRLVAPRQLYGLTKRKEILWKGGNERG